MENTDLAKRVWKQVTEFPESFRMGTWGYRAWISKGRQDLASDSRAEAENYRIAAAEFRRRARGK
jgi:hypothetical protein